MAIIHHGIVVSFYFCVLWSALTCGSPLEATRNAVQHGDKSSTNFKPKNFSVCTNCGKKLEPVRKITNSTLTGRSFDTMSLNKIIPEESEKVVFSRKYSRPETMNPVDGFVPIPGPYGAKSSRSARAHSFRPVADRSQRLRPASPRNINTVLNHAQNNRHGRLGGDLKSQADVQRRVQYRNPKGIEDFIGRSSIASENILGNGNFEIIRGGVFSDEERNEIIGSRRMARGSRSFGMPSFLEQNRYSQIQSVQFPPVYHGRIQNQFSPVYYPRGASF